MLKKDKEKVLDEVWTTDRVKTFLDLIPPAGVNTDFNQLLKAYQSMRLENFAEFVEFFTAAGKDLNATNPDGETVASIIEQHKNGSDYLALIR